MVDNSEKKLQAVFMEEKEEYEEISMVQMQEQKNETKMWYEIKLEDNRKRHNDELTGKLQNQKRQIEGEQEIKYNLSSRYQLTQKQQSKVNKIGKQYSKKIKEVENDCISKMKKKMKKNKTNLKLKLQRLMEDKEYQLRKYERKRNKELYKLEEEWRKKNKLTVMIAE